MTTTPADEELANNLTATGAVYAALSSSLVSGVRVRPPFDEDPPNSMLIEFPFLKSPYRITVERMDRRSE